MLEPTQQMSAVSSHEGKGWMITAIAFIAVSGLLFFMLFFMMFVFMTRSLDNSDRDWFGMMDRNDVEQIMGDANTNNATGNIDVNNMMGFNEGQNNEIPIIMNTLATYKPSGYALPTFSYPSDWNVALRNTEFASDPVLFVGPDPIRFFDASDLSPAPISISHLSVLFELQDELAQWDHADALYDVTTVEEPNKLYIITGVYGENSFNPGAHFEEVITKKANEDDGYILLFHDDAQTTEDNAGWEVIKKSIVQ